jgi:hypothetical protein
MMDSVGACLCILTLHVLFLLPMHSQPFGIHRLSLHNSKVGDFVLADIAGDRLHSLDRMTNK